MVLDHEHGENISLSVVVRYQDEAHFVGIETNSHLPPHEPFFFVAAYDWSSLPNVGLSTNVSLDALLPDQGGDG